MADNVLLNPGSGGDTIRTVDKAGIEAEVVILDLGSGASESLLSEGQKTKANSLPVTLASDEDAHKVEGRAADGAPPSGNPVLVAGFDETNVQSLLVTPNGRPVSTAATSAVDSDSNTLARPFTSPSLSFKLAIAPFMFNGTNWDRVRGTIADGLLVGLSGTKTSGGTTLFKSIDLDETEEEVKATAGQVYWIHAMNLAAAPRFLKFYNATAATVVVGTTVPDLTFPLATQGDTNGAGFTLAIPNGIAFGTAITIAATTGIADADAGAPGANEVVVMLGFA